MVTLRVLVGLSVAALAATAGALFLGEYEFDEALPIVAGPLLGLIIAEAAVSIGKHRSTVLAVIVAAFAVTAVLLAGRIDANQVEPIKMGAYLSAALSGLAAFVRANPWGRGERGTDTADSRHDAVRTSARR